MKLLQEADIDIAKLVREKLKITFHDTLGRNKNSQTSLGYHTNNYEPRQLT